MWIFSRAGMFSVVEAAEPQAELGSPGEVLAVRARVRKDLDTLRTMYAPELGPTIKLPGRDYPYRGYISKDDFAAVTARLALDIDYSSFKSMVASEQGALRAHLYSDVWSVMHDAERKIATANDHSRVVITKVRSKRPAKP